MSLWKIAWRSIQLRSLASALTAVSMALGVMLVVAVLVVFNVVHRAFHRGGEGYDLIVGPAKGSNLDLVFTCIFYVGQPVSTMPYSVYQDLSQSRGPALGLVRWAVPVCLGDTFKDKRVVGTTPTMFDELTYSGDQKYEFAEGHNFGWNDYFDAVVGAAAAKQAKLKLGDKFRPTHSAGGEAEHEHGAFTIVGILKPTGTPNDNALFVNIEGFYRVGGHAGKAGAALHEIPAKKGPSITGDKPSDPPVDRGAQGLQKPQAGSPSKPDEHHEDEEHAVISDSQKQVSAVLVVLEPGKEIQARTLAAEINKGIAPGEWENGQDAQAAIPSDEIFRLFENIVGNIEVVLLVFAVMIVLVAGIGIMVSIYNSMNDRRHEIAIMRALGAQRSTVMIVILLESVLLSLGGGVLGLGMGHGLLFVAGPWIAEKVNLPLSMLYFQLAEVYLIPALIVLASIVGYLPAVAAYRTDVGKSLIANP
jgi:putative ABC transport system permease protein